MPPPVMVPEPEPGLLTVRMYDGTLNVAVTVVFPLRVMVQVPVPEQPPPDQPVKVEPGAMVAVKVTTEPELSDTEQAVPPVPQVIPPPVTVPPLGGVTVRVNRLAGGGLVKVAESVLSPPTTIVQILLPVPLTLSHPVQPLKLVREAVNVTAVPKGYGNRQEPPVPLVAQPTGGLVFGLKLT